ncbi:hypothetical protein SASPL_127037 [Salvia splendens]|uniref:NB-ARC domain-containing protein n=1 Tax=Salvia splendens TaxID=180675 RepID=A0A8X8XLY1_SALSN|nr:disease resistance protein RPS2-like [Salvia splendens]KAG6414318.1 hypothetical protein SASPL_127037 [Salvia splendens]
MRRKKFVLLLDDVWEGLDLEKIGIHAPSKDNGSKVVFTTHSMEVCSDMDTDCKLKVEAMANKRSEHEWRYAVEILHKTPSQVRGMEDVFNLLKFGYDNLGSDNLRSCLSYCSLFPEDYEIEKEQLIESWAGEGFLGNGSNLHIMGHAIIGSLKVACFLETGEDPSRVKLHDVVRSFLLWIVPEQRFIMQASQGLTEAPCGERWEQAERISLMDNQITKLSQSPHCPNLSTLLFHWNNGLSKFCDGFFQNMPALKVLDLSFTNIKELPPSICRLAAIHHLDLSGTKLTTLPRELGYHGWGMQTTATAADASELRLADLERLSSLDSLGFTATSFSDLHNVSRSRFLRGCIHYLHIKECEGLHQLPLSSYAGDDDQL